MTKPRYTNRLVSDDPDFRAWATQWGAAFCRRNAVGDYQIHLKRRSGAKVATYRFKRHSKRSYYVLYGWNPRFGVRDVTFREAKLSDRFNQIATGRRCVGPDERRGIGPDDRGCGWTQSAELRQEVEEQICHWMDEDLGLSRKYEREGLKGAVIQHALPNLDIKYCGGANLLPSPARRAFREPDFEESLRYLYGGYLNRRLRRIIKAEAGAIRDAQDLLGAISLSHELLKRYKVDINHISNYLEGIDWHSTEIYKPRMQDIFWEHRELLLPLLLGRYPMPTVVKLLQGHGRVTHVHDAVRILSLIPDAIPEIKEQLPSQPNWHKLHDLISEIHDKIQTKLRHYEYQPKAQTLEGLELPSGRKIVLPKSNHELMKWGRHFSNCVGSYDSGIRSGHYQILGIMDTDQLTEVAQWTNGRCVQAETFYATDKSHQWQTALTKEINLALAGSQKESR